MLTIKNKSLNNYKFIDLFAGLGGFRLALESLGAKCVYSNEWDKAAQETYLANFGEVPEGDITKVNEKTIPDHDILCAGFPCFPAGAQVLTDQGVKAIETVQVGDRVTRGQVIGLMGQTGWATGVHVHFSVWTGYPYRSGSIPVNPMQFY